MINVFLVKEYISIIKDILYVLFLVIAMIIAGINARSGIKKINAALTERRYNNLNHLYNDFLNLEFKDVRRKTIQQWKIAIKFDSSVWNKTTLKPDKTTSLNFSLLSGDELLEYFQSIGIKINEKLVINILNGPNAKDIVKSTQYICDKYEHLGKLYKANAIQTEDIILFFFTSLADTFLGTLPYILHRRKEKPEYAHHFQNLVDIVPKVSKNIFEV
jgi:hypothetical protein